MNQKTRNPKVVAGAAVGFGLVVAVAGWMLLVSPKRSEATKLGTEISSVQSEIAIRRAALARKPKIKIDLRSADLFRLTKAVPDRTDMSGIVLALSREANRSGVSFEAITPAQPVNALGYQVQPLAVTVNGRFGQVGEFMNRLRKLVTVRKGRLDSGGRLFAVDNVELIEPEAPATFPVVKATVTVDAFVYAGGAPTGGAATPDTTTPPAPSGAVAAGATP